MSRNVVAMLTALGAVAIAGITAGATSAASVWTNTPRNIEKMLLKRWETSDGQRLVSVSCRGVWNGPHARTSRGMEFNRFRCSEWDGVNRHFRVRVVAAGRTRLRVVQVSCNDSRSSYSCP